MLLHLVGDRMPHGDLADRRFEVGSGIAAVLLLAAVRGPLDPAVTGGLAASAPDLEHLFRLPRPAGASSSRVIASTAGTGAAVFRRRSSSSSRVSSSASFFAAASWDGRRRIGCGRLERLPPETTIVLDSGMLLHPRLV
jgi:hypothetical protein